MVLRWRASRAGAPLECVSKCVVIVSSPFDFPTRGGLLYGFCSFRFAEPVEDLCMKQFWSVFPDGFLENFIQECEVCSKLSSVNTYVHMLESWKAYTGMKAQASCLNKEFEEGL